MLSMGHHPNFDVLMQRARVIFLLLIAVVLMPDAAVAQGCSMCKAVVESGDAGIFGGKQSIGAGLNNGILYLMAVPYVLLFLLFRRRIVAFVREMSSAQG